MVQVKKSRGDPALKAKMGGKVVLKPAAAAVPTATATGSEAENAKNESGVKTMAGPVGGEPPIAVSAETVEKAVGALLKWLGGERDAGKKQLIEDDDMFYMSLVFKKVPEMNRSSPYSIELPHPLYADSSREVCLFLKDREDEEYKANKEKVRQDRSSGVTKIIGLSKLSTKYAGFESKKQLCHSYDLFLADDRIVPSLAKLLGKVFFKSRKKPIPVSLKGKNWMDQIKASRNATYFYMAGGACLSVKAARTTFTKEQIVQNLMTVIAKTAKIIPGKWGNIQTIYIKTKESTSLPVYNALPILPMKIEVEKGAAGQSAADSSKKRKRKSSTVVG